MNANQSDIDKFMAVLADSPRRIVTCTVGASETSLRASPGPGQRSVAELFAEIRVCQDLCTFNIYAILSASQPILPLLDERRWGKTVNYVAVQFKDSFQAFLLRRIELINVLRQLSFEDWSRSAKIGGSSQTIFSQVRRMAFQELEHVEEIEILLGWKNG